MSTDDELDNNGSTIIKACTATTWRQFIRNETLGKVRHHH